MKKIHIIAIILVALAIAGSAFYILSQDKSQAPTEQEPTVQQPEEQTLPPEEEQSTLPVIPQLSEEELTALWANGERCSEENFPKFSRFANSFQDKGVTVSVNTMNLYLEHDGSCKDVEYIAQLVGAQIAHFDTFIRPQSDYITGSYYLKLSTNSIVELEIAVEKIKALNNNPRIKSRFISVFGSTQDFRE